MNVDPKLELPEKILQSIDKQPVNESFLTLCNYNNELKNELKKKEEFLGGIEREKSQKEYELKSLECCVSEKNEEYEKIKLLHKSQQINQKEWEERVKLEHKNKIAIMLKYHNKMAELRKILFASVSFDGEKVTQEINDIVNDDESLCCAIKLSEMSLTQYAGSYSDDKLLTEEIINEVKRLRKEFELEESVNESGIKNIEIDFHNVEQKVKQIMNEN